jgi:Iron-binding zinc finger CDGSH type
MSQTTEATVAAPMSDRPSVRLVPLTDGPLEVTGGVDLVAADGRALERPGEAVYLCRCGRSSNKPFCDGSHARTGWTEAL